MSVAIALAMTTALLITGAVLPLYGLLFHTALLTQLGQWILWPTHTLFPGWTLTPSLVNGTGDPPSVGLSWQQVPLLLGSCLLLLICYLIALRYLPQRINRRYILWSTLLIGLIGVLIPVVTSQDIFSYIIYARMSVIYHLNPLTALPTAIQADPVYQHLYWKDQPSAYGPTWIVITDVLQWLTGGAVTAMVLALRLLSLGAHIWSTLLVWSISGHLQRQKGTISLQTRMQATLAFAWNPLLLFEACVNAHNDVILLLFVLLAIWFLVRNTPLTLRALLLTITMLALATCLKVNILLLMPGLLLFLWGQPQRWRAISITLVLYGGTILLLYAPFWQGGTMLQILAINPGTYRDINNLAELLSHIYNSLAQILGAPGAPEVGSPSEKFLHTTTIAIFAILYGLICWRALTKQQGLSSPQHLIRWMTLVWLLYCAIGTPWTWPWYLVTFFGLFALIEAVDAEEWPEHPSIRKLGLPLTVRLLAFSMLSLYCFYTWGPFASFMPWLPNFRWAYWRGLWAWLLPSLILLPRVLSRTRSSSIRCNMRIQVLRAKITCTTESEPVDVQR